MAEQLNANAWYAWQKKLEKLDFPFGRQALQLVDAYADLHETNKSLVAALEAVEWCFDGRYGASCPLCHAIKEDEDAPPAEHRQHEPDCKLGNALAKARADL